MAICKETEDGGKMLIVKPSPGSMRRSLGATPIIFKLPPPPPQPPSGAEQLTKPPTEVPSKDSPPEAPSSDLPPEVPLSELPPEVPLSVPPLEDSNEVESTLVTPPVEAWKEKKREGKKKEGKVKKSKPKTSEKPKKRKTRSKTPPTEDMAHPETPPTENKPRPQTPPRTTPTENRPHPEAPPMDDTPHPHTPPRTTPTENRPHPETPPKPKVKPNRPRSKPHAQPDKVEVDLPVVAPPVSKTTMPPGSEVTPPAALEATPTTPSAMSEGVLDVSSNFSPIVSPGGGLLNATIVSNEFTNFDDLLSNSSLQDLVTTDFSIEENLEPPRNSGGDSGTGTRLDSAGMSVGSRSDSDISVTSDEGGFHIPSDDEDAGRVPARESPKKYKFQRTTPTKPSSSHASPSRSPGIRRPVPPPPPPTQHHGIGVGVTNPMMLLVNSNANNNNNNNNNVDGNSVDGNGVHDSIVAGNIVTGGAENAMGHRLSTVSTTSANSGTEGVWSPSGHGNETTHRCADGYMSGEPMSGSESDTAESAHSLEDAFDDNGEIVLLSVKPCLEQEGVALAEGDSESAAIADVESGRGHAEEGWVGEIEGSKVEETEVKMGEEGGYKMGDATLNELDNVVSDLRELMEQTTPPQDSIRVASDDAPPTDSPVNTPLPPPPPASDLPPSPPPSPPPPISSLPPSPPSSPASSRHTNPSPSPSPSSSLPPSPPPPVPVAPALPPSLTEERNIGTPPPPPPRSLPPPLTEEDATSTSPFNKKVRSRFSSKPKPPSTKPNKPKGLFKRKHSLTRSTDVDDADSAKDELFEKMRERQAKLKAEAHNSSPKHSHRTLEDSDKPSQSNSSPQNSGSGSNIDQQKNSGSGSNPSGNSGGDNVQMQLQFLQQQVIQQQMVQLQQQFQQLLAMNPGITLPGMGGAGMGMGMPNMGVGGMNVQGMAMNMPGIGMNTSPAMAGMGMNPNMNMPGMGLVQGNQMGMVAQASAVGGIPQGHPMMSPQVMAMQQQQMMSPQMVPQMMPAPQVASPQMGMASVPVQMGMASAPQMGVFDLLMDDIRETNPHNILRKVSPMAT